MTPEIQSRIFEPFFTTKGPNKGTGLGLATVYGIVKQSDGYIYVYSEPGRGTSFKIYLRSADLGAVAELPHSGVAPTLTGVETIPLVEDEDAVRAVTRLTLQGLGYQVLGASQWTEAIRHCEQHRGPIHLLLTDVVMPEMGGRELAERLTQIRHDLKVLYLSGYTDDSIIRHGVLQADVAFLQKPFTPAALATKVRNVLDH
jgi:two-component system cell cycle sensor histidine kinase/response regulator CckA